MNIVRAGVSEKFPIIKKFLKAYVLGPSDWEHEELPQLQRYANDGTFRYSSGHDGRETEFSFPDAGAALTVVGLALRWNAIQAGLSGAPAAAQLWARSAAYGYWGSRAEHRFDRHMADDYKSGGRPQYLPSLRFSRTISNLAAVFLLGWQEWTKIQLERITSSLRHSGYFDIQGSSKLSAQFFVLRLLCEHFDIQQCDESSHVLDAPIYGFLLKTWRTADPHALAQPMLAALDRHTHQSSLPKREGPDADFRFHEDWYFPYEILTVLKLRELAGLANPTADQLAHPLTSTPLGQLAAPAPEYWDPLLNSVVLRLRDEFKDI